MPVTLRALGFVIRNHFGLGMFIWHKRMLAEEFYMARYKNVFLSTYVSALVIGVVGYCVIIWMCVGSVLRHNSIYCFNTKMYLNIRRSHLYCQSAMTEFDRKNMLCNFVNEIVRNVCQNNLLQRAETIKILCALGYVNFLNNSCTYLVMTWWYFSYMLVHYAYYYYS